MIGKILVGTTAGGGFDESLKLAAELASSNDAELVVLELAPPIDARDVFDPDGVSRQPSHVRRLESDYPGLRLRTSEARGLPVNTLCDVAEKERPDLLVVAQGRRRRGALISRRASSALVERAPCSVLLVAA